jgi:hypothetical protein
MNYSNKLILALSGIVIIIVVFSLAFYALSQHATNPLANLPTADVMLAIVNGVATATLAIVAAMNGIEAKKVRSEIVRPRLALEPTYYEYDKTGELVGFNCLNIVNGGTVARDVEIDVSYKGKSSFLYNCSIGTNSRVQIWTGKSSELGGSISVAVRYKNMYNKSLQEVLSLNLDSLNAAKRKFVPVHDSSRNEA